MSIGQTSLLQNMATIGFMFNQAEQHLNRVTEQAAQNARLSVMEVGQQIAFNLDRARAIYQDEMEKTVDQVSAEVSRNIQLITSAAFMLEQNTSADARDRLDQFQTSCNATLFSDKTPQFTRITGQYYFPSRTQDKQTFTFKGNFPHIATQEAVLVLGDKKYTPIETSITYIRFNVPYNDLPQVSTDCINPTSGKLHFLTRSFFFWTAPVGSYSITLGCLPISPGRIELITTSYTSQKIERDSSSPTYRQSSSRHESNRDLNNPYQAHPADGWRIVKDSPRLQTISTNRPHDGKSTPRGSWRHNKESETEQSVVFRVQTTRLNHGNSGDVTFRIAFREYQNQNIPEQHQNTVDLGWGENRSIDVPSNIYTVRFTAFDGTTSELAGINLMSRYITVLPRPNGIIIAVKNPSEIDFS